MVGSQALGQRGGGVVGLFGNLCIDHNHQQILKLRKKFLEGLGALPPRQARGKHRVRVGGDPEVTGRV